MRQLPTLATQLQCNALEMQGDTRQSQGKVMRLQFSAMQVSLQYRWGLLATCKDTSSHPSLPPIYGHAHNCTLHYNIKAPVPYYEDVISGRIHWTQAWAHEVRASLARIIIGPSAALLEMHGRTLTMCIRGRASQFHS